MLSLVEFGPSWMLLPWAAAMLSTWCASRWISAPNGNGRSATIDGLRGHLATLVFIHHGSIWWDYLRTGHWNAPKSPLFNHLGQTSVALFFMITAYLFVGRLLDTRHSSMDWLKLYVSRVLRLTPVYGLMLAGVLFACGAISGWERTVSWRELLEPLGHWFFFTIGGAPDINKVHHTFSLVAGVTWSLPIEWAFYLALPTLHCLITRRRPTLLTVITLLPAMWIWAKHSQPAFLWAFLAGGASAWLARRLNGAPMRTHWGSAFSLICLVLAVKSNHDVKHFAPMLLVSLAFLGIVLGADLFGFLRLKISQQIGELAYGIYLLHGLTLFASFNFLMNPAKSASLTATEHGLVLTAMAPVVIGLAFLVHVCVEKPFMTYTTSWTNGLRGLISKPHPSHQG